MSRHLRPADVHAAAPPAPVGWAFLAASRAHRCLWPLAGSGAELRVCGDRRCGKAWPYCAKCYRKAVRSGA
jgi:hypothetical protein